MLCATDTILALTDEIQTKVYANATIFCAALTVVHVVVKTV